MSASFELVRASLRSCATHDGVWVLSTAGKSTRSKPRGVSKELCMASPVWGKLGERRHGGWGKREVGRSHQSHRTRRRDDHCQTLGGRISVAIVPAPRAERSSDSADRQIPLTFLHMQLRLRCLRSST